MHPFALPGDAHRPRPKLIQAADRLPPPAPHPTVAAAAAHGKGPAPPSDDGLNTWEVDMKAGLPRLATPKWPASPPAFMRYDNLLRAGQIAVNWNNVLPIEGSPGHGAAVWKERMDFLAAMIADIEPRFAISKPLPDWAMDVIEQAPPTPVSPVSTLSTDGTTATSLARTRSISAPPDSPVAQHPAIPNPRRHVDAHSPARAAAPAPAAWLQKQADLVNPQPHAFAYPRTLAAQQADKAAVAAAPVGKTRAAVKMTPALAAALEAPLCISNFPTVLPFAAASPPTSPFASAVGVFTAVAAVQEDAPQALEQAPLGVPSLMERAVTPPSAAQPHTLSRPSSHNEQQAAAAAPAAVQSPAERRRLEPLPAALLSRLPLRDIRNLGEEFKQAMLQQHSSDSAKAAPQTLDAKPLPQKQVMCSDGDKENGPADTKAAGFATPGKENVAPAVSLTGRNAAMDETIVSPASFRRLIPLSESSLRPTCREPSDTGMDRMPGLSLRTPPRPQADRDQEAEGRSLSLSLMARLTEQDADEKLHDDGAQPAVTTPPRHQRSFSMTELAIATLPAQQEPGSEVAGCEALSSLEGSSEQDPLGPGSRAALERLVDRQKAREGSGAPSSRQEASEAAALVDAWVVDGAAGGKLMPLLAADSGVGRHASDDSDAGVPTPPTAAVGARVVTAFTPSLPPPAPRTPPMDLSRPSVTDQLSRAAAKLLTVTDRPLSTGVSPMASRCGSFTGGQRSGSFNGVKLPAMLDLSLSRRSSRDEQTAGAGSRSILAMATPGSRPGSATPPLTYEQLPAPPNTANASQERAPMLPQVPQASGPAAVPKAAAADGKPWPCAAHAGAAALRALPNITAATALRAATVTEDDAGLAISAFSVRKQRRASEADAVSRLASLTRAERSNSTGSSRGRSSCVPLPAVSHSKRSDTSSKHLNGADDAWAERNHYRRRISAPGSGAPFEQYLGGAAGCGGLPPKPEMRRSTSARTTPNHSRPTTAHGGSRSLQQSGSSFTGSDRQSLAAGRGAAADGVRPARVKFVEQPEVSTGPALDEAGGWRPHSAAASGAGELRTRPVLSILRSEVPKRSSSPRQSPRADDHPDLQDDQQFRDQAVHFALPCIAANEQPALIPAPVELRRPVTPYTPPATPMPPLVGQERPDAAVAGRSKTRGAWKHALEGVRCAGMVPDCLPTIGASGQAARISARHAEPSFSKGGRAHEESRRPMAAPMGIPLVDFFDNDTQMESFSQPASRAHSQSGQQMATRARSASVMREQVLRMAMALAHQ